MEIFTDGTIAGYWNSSMFPLVGFGIATLAVFFMLGRAPWGMGGLSVRGLAILALVATIPLAMERAGLRVAIADREVVIFLSILGSAVATAFLTGSPFMRRSAPGFLQAVSTWTRGGKPMQQQASPVQHKQQNGPGTVLTVANGESAGTMVSLSEQGTVLTIGRGNDNDIVIDDPTVSRNHARVEYQGDRVFIKDLGSANGLQIDGERVQAGALQPGSNIKLGKSELVLSRKAPASPAVADNLTGDPMPSLISNEAPWIGDTVTGGPTVPNPAWLVVRSGSRSGTSFNLHHGDYTIGRAHDNDIVIEDAEVSRAHAILRYRDGHFSLHDLASSSGTRVNGERVGGTAWKEGSTVQMGNTGMKLVGYQQQMSKSVYEDAPTIFGNSRAAGAAIVVQGGPDAAKTFQLKEGNNTVGRDESNDCVLSDETVSRQHCIVRLEKGSVSVFDAGSSVGTLVDGIKRTGNQLKMGDSVTVGTTTLEFVKA